MTDHFRPDEENKQMQPDPQSKIGPHSLSKAGMRWKV